MLLLLDALSCVIADRDLAIESNYCKLTLPPSFCGAQDLLKDRVSDPDFEPDP